jgi:hypothetical protein
MTIQTGGPIKPIEKHEDTDNRGTILTDFWEYHDTADKIEAANPIPMILDLVKRATKNVFIHTPMIADGELIREIENSESKLFYAITRSVEKHDSIKNIIMRENPDLASTMVIVDARTEHVAGYWFPGMITHNVPFVLSLTRDQAREAHAHFSHLFWNATGEELFHGKTRPVKPCSPPPRNISPALNNSIRIDGIESLVSDRVLEMWIPSNAPETITKYHPTVRTLKVEITDDLKDRIYLDTIDSEVYGRRVGTPIYIKTNNKAFVGDNDLGFLLTRSQEEILNTIYSAWPFQYFKEKRIGDISTERILTGQWGKAEPVPIIEKAPLHEDNVVAETIDEWLHAEKKPAFSTGIVLAKTVRHEWRVEPPYLRKDAKRHHLYKNWEDFSARLRNEATATIKELDENLDKAGNPLDKLLALRDKGRWESWKKALEETASEDWSMNHDRNQLEKAVEQLYEIKRSLEQEKQARKNAEAEESSVLGEVKKSGKGKDKEKPVEKPEKESKPKKFEDDDERSPLVEVKLDEKGLNSLKSRIPNNPLPSVGTLYELNSRNYLCIKTIEEIEEARKLLADYKPPAIIAVER